MVAAGQAAAPAPTTDAITGVVQATVDALNKAGVLLGQNTVVTPTSVVGEITAAQVINVMQWLQTMPAGLIKA